MNRSITLVIGLGTLVGLTPFDLLSFFLYSLFAFLLSHYFSSSSFLLYFLFGSFKHIACTARDREVARLSEDSKTD